MKKSTLTFIVMFVSGVVLAAVHYGDFKCGYCDGSLGLDMAFLKSEVNKKVKQWKPGDTVKINDKIYAYNARGFWYVTDKKAKDKPKTGGGRPNPHGTPGFDGNLQDWLTEMEYMNGVCVGSSGINCSTPQGRVIIERVG